MYLESCLWIAVANNLLGTYQTLPFLNLPGLWLLNSDNLVTIE